MKPELYRQILRFSLMLYAHPTIARSTAESIIKNVNDLINNSLMSSLKSDLLKSLSDNKDSNILKDINEVFTQYSNIFENFTTENLAIKAFTNDSLYVKPQSFEIGEETYFVIIDENTIEAKTRKFKAVHVSLVESLQKFLERDGMLQQILNHVQSLKEENVVVSNCIQAELWNNKYNSGDKEIKLPLEVFYDDFETRNGLGSHAGEQKCGGVYVLLPVLPPHLVSKSVNCFLTTIFYSKFKKACGNYAIFKKLIEDLNYLCETGINIQVGQKTVKIYFELTLFLGDNLGMNSVCGFSEGFTGNKFCRICTAKKSECKIMIEEDPSKIRNKVNYEIDVRKICPCSLVLKKTVFSTTCKIFI